MSNLSTLAQEYQINTSKPFFPVNSLRLLYFMISDHYTHQSPDARQMISRLIPAVEAVFDARAAHRGNASTATVQSDFETAESQLREVFSIVDTPQLHNAFAQLFTYIYPLQDEIFLNLYQELLAEGTASPQHLHLLTHARAMDSIIFSTVLNQVILQFAPAMDETQQQQLQLTLHHHINLAYQINDIVDAVVFAKDDLESNSFSPFRLIQKISPEPTAAKELIKTTLAGLQAKTEVFAFPAGLKEQTDEFYQELIGVVHPGS